MDLDLPDMDAISPIITCTIVGILEPEDLAALAAGVPSIQGEAAPSAPQAFVLPPEDSMPDLKKIRERHHTVARLLAQGMQQSLIAAIVGYTEAYLSVLKNAPAMQELIELYRIKQGAAAQVITENLRTVGGKALEKLNAKLDADSIDDVHELVAISKLGLDRAGHGPQTTSHNVTESHVIDHAKLAEHNQRAKEGSRPFIKSLDQARALPSPAAAATVKGDDTGAG